MTDPTFKPTDVKGGENFDDLPLTVTTSMFMMKRAKRKEIEKEN